MPDTDNIKGKAKEAAGDVTDDKRLKRKGKVDRAAGSAKSTASHAVDKAKDVAARATEKGEKALDED